MWFSGAESYVIETSSEGADMGETEVTSGDFKASNLSPGVSYVFTVFPVGLQNIKGITSTAITESTSMKLFNVSCNQNIRLIVQVKSLI